MTGPTAYADLSPVAQMIVRLDFAWVASPEQYSYTIEEGQAVLWHDRGDGRLVRFKHPAAVAAP